MKQSNLISLAKDDKLSTKTVGSKILVYEAVGSTNEVAAQLAREADFVEGQVIITDEQTAGTGRMGRKWLSPKGKGILMSAILTPRLNIQHLPAITAIGALAVLDAVKESTALPAKVRWPNDVVLDDKKIAGVLARMENVNRPSRCFILGIGFNVNLSEDDFPPDIPPATSLYICRKKPLDRLTAARTLLQALDRWYSVLKSGGFAAIEERLRESSSLTGRTVTVISGAETLTGKVTGISLFNGLHLTLPDETTRVFHESTATLVPDSGSR